MSYVLIECRSRVWSVNLHTGDITPGRQRDGKVVTLGDDVDVETYLAHAHGTQFCLDRKGNLHRWTWFDRWKGAVCVTTEVEKVRAGILEKFVGVKEGVEKRALACFLSRYQLTDNTLCEDIEVNVRIGQGYWDINRHTQEVVEREGPIDRRVRVIDLSTGNRKDDDNLTTLFRQKTEMSLREDRGRLVEAARFYYLSSDQESRITQTRFCVMHALQALERSLGKINNEEKILKPFFSHLFQKRGVLSRMSQQFFCRGWVEESGRLESFLQHNFAEKRKALIVSLKSYYQDPSVKNKKSLKRVLIDFLYEEYLFTDSLGLKLQRVSEGGTGGARYAFDRFGRKILVIKPGDEGPYGVNNPVWYSGLKRAMFEPRACLGGEEPNNEQLSYEVAESFNTGVVPPTEVRQINNDKFVGWHTKKCSIQAFVGGAQTLKSVLGISDFQQLNRKRLREALRDPSTSVGRKLIALRSEGKPEYGIPSDVIEQVALHDWLTGNIDWHFDNVLYKKKGDPDPRIRALFSGGKVDIEALVNSFFTESLYYDLLDELLYCSEEDGVTMLIKHDGGASMPHAHPEGYLSTRFRFLVAALPQFDRPFSEAMRARLKDEKTHKQFWSAYESVVVQSLADLATGPIFKGFWKEAVNRKMFKQWLVGSAATHVNLTDMATELSQLCYEHYKDKENIPSKHKYVHFFVRELERIKKVAQTMENRWVTLQFKHFGNSPPTMREIFEIINKEQFEKILRPPEEGEKEMTIPTVGKQHKEEFLAWQSLFEEQKREWVTAEVPENIEFPEDETRYTSQAYLFKGHLRV